MDSETILDRPPSGQRDHYGPHPSGQRPLWTPLPTPFWSALPTRLAWQATRTVPPPPRTGRLRGPVLIPATGPCTWPRGKSGKPYAIRTLFSHPTPPANRPSPEPESSGKTLCHSNRVCTLGDPPRFRDPPPPPPRAASGKPYAIRIFFFFRPPGAPAAGLPGGGRAATSHLKLGFSPHKCGQNPMQLLRFLFPPAPRHRLAM